VSVGAGVYATGMEIYAVAVSARDLPRAVVFYQSLGFDFGAVEPGDPHLEAVTPSGVRLMIDSASMMTELLGEPPRPGNTSGFALRYGSPAEVDEVAARVPAGGGTAVHEPWDAPWGQRYATVADPDGYRVDLFCPLPADTSAG
jgi:catechol 2,3-dioxygenase-like lactoylglutathione lyase family enzyme